MSTEHINLTAFNTMKGLSHGDTAQAIVNDTLRDKPVVAVFSEAFLASDPGSTWNALEDFDKANYLPMYVPNQEIDDVDRPDASGLVMLVDRRWANGKMPTAVKQSGRYALKASLTNPQTGVEFDVLGFHGNDKNDALRMADGRALLSGLNRDPSGAVVDPTILLGDMNTMSRDLRVAKALRAMSLLIKCMPASAPDPNYVPGSLPAKLWHKVTRVGSLAQRSAEMAKGGSLELFLGAGFENTDPESTVTIRKMKVLAFDLDHVLKTPQFETISHGVVESPSIDGDTSGRRVSDHRKVRVQLATPIAS